MKKTLLLLLPLCLCCFSAEALAVTYTVLMNHFAFEPKTITVNQGDMVIWENIDHALYGGIFHTTTSGTDCTYDGTGWDSGTVQLGHSFQKTFDNAGEYPYFCRFHCLSTGMTGTVVVTQAPPAGKIDLTLPAAEEWAVRSPSLPNPPSGGNSISSG